MFQDDMVIYCVVIKEFVVDGKFCFGIVFVDVVIGQFLIFEFEDDVDFIKFEIFVVQICFWELVLEKLWLFIKVFCIFKNNIVFIIIWNYFKFGIEFWDVEMLRWELECNGYFFNVDNQEEVWLEKFEKVKEKDFLMLVFGGLVYYLCFFKFEWSLFL